MNRLKNTHNVINTISFIIIISFIILQFLLNKLVNSSRINRIILGEQYIAGTWIEVIYNNEKDKEVGYGIKRISYDNDLLNYEGDNFDIKALTHTGSFSANFLALKFPYINYKYTWDKNGSFEKHEGIGQVKFIKRTKKVPIVMTGFFIDLKEGQKFNFTSWKITDNEILQKIENPKTHKETLISTIRQFKDDNISKNIN